MSRRRRDKTADRFTLGSAITRRDFIGATLIGAGTGLLSMAAPSALRAQGHSGPTGMPPEGFEPDWTGPGGLGDYRDSNGNTHEVVNAGHKLAKGAYRPLPGNAIDTGEMYDMVMVGGGFAGLSAAVTAMWEGKKCLVCDNHPIFGGEGKMNLFDVDGVKLYAPQGSNDFSLPNKLARETDSVDPYWEKLGLPMDFKFAEPAARIRGKIKVARDNFGPQIHQRSHATQAHFYFNKTGDGGTWAMHPWENGFKEAPIEASEKDEIMRFVKDVRVPPEAQKAGWQAWLDSMSYRDFIEKVMGFSPRMTAYMDMVVAAGYTGCACEHVSAYGAHTFAYPVT
ncbi:MAG: FAD-binding protein, partial [Pseudomonadota bacterium]